MVATLKKLRKQHQKFFSLHCSSSGRHTFGKTGTLIEEETKIK